jgi:hypothetical protein
VKRSRGQAYGIQPYNITEIFEIVDSVKNDAVIDWAVPLVKRNLVERFHGSSSPFIKGIFARMIG